MLAVDTQLIHGLQGSLSLLLGKTRNLHIAHHLLIEGFGIGLVAHEAIYALRDELGHAAVGVDDARTGILLRLHNHVAKRLLLDAGHTEHVHMGKEGVEIRNLAQEHNLLLPSLGH